MFSTEERTIYSKNQLAEVLCQLRFPEILMINSQLPAQFQEEIREEFPLYSTSMETVPNHPDKTPNYQFASADGVWRVNLTGRFISLSCSRYTCWEDFAQKLDKPLAAFIEIYRPAFFERIGLRYINFISRKDLSLSEVPFSDLIQPRYLSLLADEDVSEQGTSRCSVDAELSIRGGCRAKIHAGPGMVKHQGKTDSEVKYVFDQDLYMRGNIPVNLSAGALQTLHGQSYSIFRDAITDQLHQAMQPQY